MLLYRNIPKEWNILNKWLACTEVGKKKYNFQALEWHNRKVFTLLLEDWEFESWWCQRQPLPRAQESTISLCTISLKKGGIGGIYWQLQQP